ncbi:MAG: type II toxin-antitoxin system HicB family antitoxin [Chloroflexota bacterium]
MTRRYLIVVERADGNYSAYSPDIPGCVAVGDTPEEVIRNMREAIVFHVQGLIEDRLPVPEPRTTAEYLAVQV